MTRSPSSKPILVCVIHRSAEVRDANVRDIETPLRLSLAMYPPDLCLYTPRTLVFVMYSP